METERQQRFVLLIIYIYTLYTCLFRHMGAPKLHEEDARFLEEYGSI